LAHAAPSSSVVRSRSSGPFACTQYPCRQQRRRAIVKTPYRERHLGVDPRHGDAPLLIIAAVSLHGWHALMQIGRI
jgi:hypothetical protein